MEKWVLAGCMNSVFVLATCGNINKSVVITSSEWLGQFGNDELIEY